ncbi:hypothetical protein FH609_011050 [Streptomyces sp. 3MP-14]|uniref:Uncharacterized protein n=1 Tax=Streptomyces mimosae TaxID=2586635 RepID=A0A5N6AFJ3_9ACTN|nr:MULTISPECIES: hypothetical protein [Streptomyces]KAB8166942.1 hypothetical protein FH607_008500 [Streptomyces mimosae]KAB8176883.1 hypothetical protein FH609_011050 [Streptomyces sp. 3MP-14]
MAITDDLRKTLTDSTPLYVAAGTADLAAQKLRELPATLDRLRAEAPERLPKLRERAQHAALTGVGLALEYAVKARETYDGLAERGKTVVERRRGEDEPAEGWSEVKVERAPVTEPVTEPASVTEEAEAAEAKEAAGEAPAGATEKKDAPARPRRANGSRRAAAREPRKMPPKD